MPGKLSQLKASVCGPARLNAESLARHDRHGALANQRDRHRVGAHAVARDAEGGVGGVEEG